MSKLNVTLKGYNPNSRNDPNTKVVTVNNLDLYFSYETVIAFRTPKTGLVVHENDWSTTTGKHLNYIDGGDKKNRLDDGAFNDQLDKVLANAGS